MKVLTLKVGEKTYTTSRITAYLSRKAMEIQTKSIELAKFGQEIQVAEDPDLEAVQDLMLKLSELQDSKSFFLCQVYGEKFSMEDLEQSLTNEEIEDAIQKITNGIYGVIEKNG